MRIQSFPYSDKVRFLLARIGRPDGDMGGDMGVGDCGGEVSEADDEM